MTKEWCLVILVWKIMSIFFSFTSHCVLLKHYYSVDFPWWFDRKISFFSLLSKTWKLEKEKLSNDRNSKLHFVIWQKNCFCWILSACSSGLRFHINLEAKSMHGSSWKKKSIISEFTLFFAGQVLFTVNGLNWSQSWQVLIFL